MPLSKHPLDRFSPQLAEMSSELCRTYKMERFAKIINDFQSLSFHKMLNISMFDMVLNMPLSHIFYGRYFCLILTEMSNLSNSKWPFLFYQIFSLLSYDLNLVSLNYVDVKSLRQKSSQKTFFKRLVLEFPRITNSTSERFV